MREKLIVTVEKVLADKIPRDRRSQFVEAALAKFFNLDPLTFEPLPQQATLVAPAQHQVAKGKVPAAQLTAKQAALEKYGPPPADAASYALSAIAFTNEADEARAVLDAEDYSAWYCWYAHHMRELNATEASAYLLVEAASANAWLKIGRKGERPPITVEPSNLPLFELPRARPDGTPVPYIRDKNKVVNWDDEATLAGLNFGDEEGVSHENQNI